MFPDVLKKIPLTFLIITGLFLSGCGGGSDDSSADSDTLTIGFIQTGAESDWRKAHTVSVKEEAEKRGYNLKFADGQGKPENQIKAFSSFVVQRVDAIILAPIVETGWETALRKAKAAGIPVLILDRTVDVSDDSLFATYVGADTYQEGIQAAEWVVKETGGKANIVELQGTPGSSPAINRLKSFKSVIDQHPGLKIIDSQSGDFRRANGKQVMEAMLKKHGPENIDLVYAHNDDMALGAIQAIEEAGLKPAVYIKLISIDAVRAAFEAMVDGKLNCVVECNPLQGPLAFDLLEKILAGETVAKDNRVKDEVFEMAHAAEDIKTRAY
ncbi:ABC transporter substrate-binding protein [Pelagicoccus mobilis]|uniref:ABC transporter substrate-binding protein n=1 Tax=Pelagicoccus mobilis TaxID=415221 RepID=A0A934S4Q1_9BACT|nr:ABC transporter substrate-binding protein [Pelagicoccus mobilis]MBK1878958.1 ABC transporter substrate-binding protein [Pelagicoccus mobilis]